MQCMQPAICALCTPNFSVWLCCQWRLSGIAGSSWLVYVYVGLVLFGIDTDRY
ncbi:hypothetical protein ASPFODRAFT_611146 [Aspergillus luchuensis CBS 106.47]|uniref:Uncharacterized protein n=1 Tax=Aspergillus luchuensis (strain CBS 106.47) TaxID=1137211 RepID=A0A1M3TJ59_ASPLC|nr:hypothetical protein ASPFODRAFT_611146 [Aspergillus luchuensis CBS 106.47]